METRSLRKSSTDSKYKAFFEDNCSRKGPLILEENVLFDENHQLRAVYGKPVSALLLFTFISFCSYLPYEFPTKGIGERNFLQ